MVMRTGTELLGMLTQELSKPAEFILIYIYIPVVPARGGAEVALKIYIRPFSSIELACAVRQPSPCVRALCETDVVFHMSHLKPHVTLHT